MEKLNNVLQTYTTTENFYGEANELVKTVQETYNTKLSAAQPFDWRSGTVNGVPQDFDNSLTVTKQCHSQVVTEYSQDGNVIQLVTTYTSMASRQVGMLKRGLDAVRKLRQRLSVSLLLPAPWTCVPIPLILLPLRPPKGLLRSTSLALVDTSPPVEAGPMRSRSPCPCLCFLLQTQKSRMPLKRTPSTSPALQKATCTDCRLEKLFARTS